MQTFSIKTVDGGVYLIDGNSVKDIFSRIDGLRLMGKRWLETYLFNSNGEMFSVYVNIDQIVSIQ
jgi:hypothetical protein